MNKDDIKHFGLDFTQYPAPLMGTTYRDYHAMFPTAPSSILRHHFPNLKSHDISNFMKSLPTKEKARFQNRGVSTGLSINQTPEIIKENLAKKMEAFLTEELKITKHDFDKGLTSEQAQSLARKKMSTGYGKDIKRAPFMDTRYLDTEVNKERLTKGHTLFCTLLNECYPGKDALERAHLHPIMFQQSKAIKISMTDLLDALLMYYRYHHTKMRLAEQMYTKSGVTSSEQMTEKLWAYWSIQISSKTNNFYTSKTLAGWGFNGNVFKHVVSSYLNLLCKGTEVECALREGLLKRHTQSGGRLSHTGVVHELLSIHLGFRDVDCDVDCVEAWSAKRFEKQNPALKRCCVGCGDNRAVEWHHIGERSEYPSRTYDSSNVIPICAHIHAMITRKSFKNDEYTKARDCFLNTGDKAGVIKWVKDAHKNPSLEI